MSLHSKSSRCAVTHEKALRHGTLLLAHDAVEKNGSASTWITSGPPRLGIRDITDQEVKGLSGLP